MSDDWWHEAFALAWAAIGWYAEAEQYADEVSKACSRTTWEHERIDLFTRCDRALEHFGSEYTEDSMVGLYQLPSLIEFFGKRYSAMVKELAEAHALKRRD
jgi:hypothetical protein